MKNSCRPGDGPQLPRVTVVARNISLLAALQSVAQAASMEVHDGEWALSISPAKPR